MVCDCTAYSSPTKDERLRVTSAVEVGQPQHFHLLDIHLPPRFPIAVNRCLPVSFADAVLADGNDGDDGYVAKCGSRLHQRRWLHAATEAVADDCSVTQSLALVASAETAGAT